MALAASIIKRTAVSATIRSRDARARTVAVLLLLMWGAGVVMVKAATAVTTSPIAGRSIQTAAVVTQRQEHAAVT